MRKERVTLRGLKGNEKNSYHVGDIVYRKYNKEWHIYVRHVEISFGYGKPISTTVKAINSVDYVNSNPDLLEALKKAGKPLSNINDKEDNVRLGIRDIEIHYDPRSAAITKHKIKAGSPEKIKVHKDIVKEREEIYSKLSTFGSFMSILNYNLTYELSNQNNKNT
jgi:hypothetical protein